MKRPLIIVVTAIVGVVAPIAIRYGLVKKKSQPLDFKENASPGTVIWKSSDGKFRIITAPPTLVGPCWRVQFKMKSNPNWQPSLFLQNKEDVQLFINSKSR